MTLDTKKKQSTAVITDIRNFSGTFKDFQFAGSDAFLNFLDDYYTNQHALAELISDDIHISSTGDGILTIFKGKDHFKEGFAYVLASHKLLTNMCADFNGLEWKNKADISFGIGADSGHVWALGKGHLNTYVGTVINRAARIEGVTKLFAETTTAIGNSLYKFILQEFYPTAYEMLGDKKYAELINTNPEAVLISKHFMLQYIFVMALKGIQDDAPIFRLDGDLAGDDDLYWCIMEKLCDKVKDIKNMIE